MPGGWIDQTEKAHPKRGIEARHHVKTGPHHMLPCGGQVIYLFVVAQKEYSRHFQYLYIVNITQYHRLNVHNELPNQANLQVDPQLELSFAVLAWLSSVIPHARCCRPHHNYACAHVCVGPNWRSPAVNRRYCLLSDTFGSMGRCLQMWNSTALFEQQSAGTVL